MKCPQCDNEEISLIQPGIFACGYCEYTFTADEVDFDEERFYQIEGRIAELERRLAAMEHNKFNEEDDIESD